MLEVKNLSKSFSDIKVLDNISCTIDSGKLVALLGRNGSGKTTFLKCISNIMNTDSGDINYNGSNFLFLNDKANIFSDLTILNNLKCILRLYNQDFNEENYEKYLVLLELKEFVNSFSTDYLSFNFFITNKDSELCFLYPKIFTDYSYL